MTGHTGFLGGWTCAWLQALGAEPVGFSRGARAAVKGIRGDLRDAAAVTMALAASQASVVLHLGGQATTRRAAAERRVTYETNVVGTLNVLEAVARVAGVRACVIAGSSRAPDVAAIPDAAALDPYNASKRAAEAIVPPYSAECPVAIARPGVLVGGGDASTGRLIPALLAALQRGEDPAPRTPRSVRPWLHVLEAASGILWLGACLASGHATTGAEYSFGLERPAEAATVGAVMDRLVALWRGREPSGLPQSADLDDAYTLDCCRARDELGWRPAWTLDEALAATVQWHRDGDATTDQIAAYAVSAQAGGVTWARA